MDQVVQIFLNPLKFGKKENVKKYSTLQKLFVRSRCTWFNYISYTNFIKIGLHGINIFNFNIFKYGYTICGSLYVHSYIFHSTLVIFKEAKGGKINPRWCYKSKTDLSMKYVSSI